MRSAIRYLFLATVIVALAAFGSGAAAATMIVRPTPPVAAIGPSNGQVVGVAHPVTIRFAAPVTDRAKTEQSIDIRTTRPLPGTFAWTDDREAVWTPSGFLPADATVLVSVGGARTEFRTNAGVFGDANMSAHTFTVTVGGTVVRTMPASMGKPGYETPAGTWPVLEKFRSVVFDSRTIGIPLSSPEGYVINGEFAERLTWGGVFIHSAPWSVDQQGYANVSHGCINLSRDDAEWVYHTIGVGDPVVTHW
ncbi:L,D-transpeptidase [Nocardia gamkensis]|jgi:lipoprotein-anchoring transpeptidase ErfK/SrfK|uniref:L,D-transpeptidase n=1 Tax=Nocardia gamkensis TaxID=352869 RepID=A0A7X6R0U4_9NOCA|nr:L,D-transpeptidase [Nocardia gamkensis]NKY24684.1 L,D-transpeptidase [Nocardia gamkensis]NQE69845.1 L,D-transpeptidase 2 [Nocardia gamkensis]